MALTESILATLSRLQNIVMNSDYQPLAIEQSAQQYWDENKCFKVTEDYGREKFYCLAMFPYPSGDLHMGHVRNYTIADVVSRYQRQRGKNVLQPIGWDAFGLPAENAAIKHKTHPATWTRKNIDNMRNQLQRLGFAYDWRREFATCDPDYYRWEQWLFTKLFEKGLVYKKNAMVNWDPVDETVLANEQVVDGRGWRSGALVEKREIAQWFIKITDYADELLADLDKLDGWPAQVKTMQRNWIGRSQGAEIVFRSSTDDQKVKVFTTRIDTLYGCTYIAIAPEHPLAQQAAQDKPELAEFIQTCQLGGTAEADLAQAEKVGMDTGLRVIHPLTGQELPLWVANYVLMEYGSGAVMCVPAHDQRDFEFAQRYQLPMQVVIKPTAGEWDYDSEAMTQFGTLINSEQFSDLSSEQALEDITDHLAQQSLAKARTTYRLRDWGVSRQRYWGAPIPIIHCEDCGAQPVPEQDLPVILPEDADFTGATSPLLQSQEFLQANCPKCGGDAQRETDTFDTFMESSWYYARFACVNQNTAMLDDRAKYWTPVDFYVGGVEHAVMHLLYARFLHKVMRDFDLLNSDEPFAKLMTQGMVLKDGAKMSKSKGNTVDPNALIEQYGADTVRLFSMFAAPPEQSLEWSDAGVDGAYRFMRRLYAYAHDYEAIHIVNEALQDGIRIPLDWAQASDELKQVRREVHQLLQQALYDYERHQFNTVVSACMKILNLLQTLDNDVSHAYKAHLTHEGFGILLRLLAPITPHVCHFLWQSCGYGDDVLTSKWPRVSKEALKAEHFEFVVQINGKKRAQVKIAADADDAAIETTVLAAPDVQRFTDGKNVRKVIVLATRKLVNVVVAE